MVALHTLETVADGTLDRLSVPGGWLYRTRSSSAAALAYVPDAAAAVGEPVAPPVNRDVPYVSLAGGTASCTTGNWENEPTGYSYAWQRDGVPIAGAADAMAYATAPADSGHSLTCIVTAGNVLGSTAAPPSNAVAVV